MGGPTSWPSLGGRVLGMLRRLRAGSWSIAQSAAAATAAYSLAVFLLGHERPFFAPIAAVVALRVTLGRRAEATRALAGPNNLTTSVLVGRVRSAAVDLLRSTGEDQEATVIAVVRAAGRATEIG